MLDKTSLTFQRPMLCEKVYSSVDNIAWHVTLKNLYTYYSNNSMVTHCLPSINGNNWVLDVILGTSVCRRCQQMALFKSTNLISYYKYMQCRIPNHILRYQHQKSELSIRLTVISDTHYWTVTIYSTRNKKNTPLHKWFTSLFTYVCYNLQDMLPGVDGRGGKGPCPPNHG